MTSITIKEYFSVEGSRFSNKDAAIIGPVLDDLGRQGEITTRDVVDVARSPNSLLHKYFEWDDHAAADKYRNTQAREMMRSILVKYEDDEGVKVESRVVQTIVRSDAATRTPQIMRSFRVLHGDSAFAVKMMEQSYDDLISWRRKYQPYIAVWTRFGDAFQEVLNQIDEFAEDAAGTDLPAETDDALLKLISWREEYKRVLDSWIACKDQMAFMVEAIDSTEKVFAEVFVGKLRDCLRCNKSFYSTDAGHRVCDSCRSNKTFIEHAGSPYETLE